MDLPVNPPLSPMLAKSAKGIPDPANYEDGLLFEPKWDGFRCIIFRDGDEVELGSRNERPLTRYFPELVDDAPGVHVDRVAGAAGVDHRRLGQQVGMRLGGTRRREHESRGVTAGQQARVEVHAARHDGDGRGRSQAEPRAQIAVHLARHHGLVSLGAGRVAADQDDVGQRAQQREQ